MLSGFTYSRIVIIKSLDSQDHDTAEMLRDFLEEEKLSVAPDLPVEVVNCEYAEKFLDILQELSNEAESGSIPILHVECHGDKKDGLIFANGSELSWEKVAGALLTLNVATEFNLLSFFSACFGAYFIEQMGAINPAPCWCLVAPTETIDSGDIVACFRPFYTALLKEQDMGKVIKAISKIRSHKGLWLCTFAEEWFIKLIIGYIETSCTKLATRKRAQEIYRTLKMERKRNPGMKHLGIGAILREMQARNREALLGHYFDTYFITDKIPTNNQRFSNTKKRLTSELSNFRSTGRYVL